MMEPIRYIDRLSQEVKIERVCLGSVLELMYGKGLLSKFFGRPLVYFVSRFRLCSQFVGWWNKLSLTQKNIVPFIEQYGIDSSEFLMRVKDFKSFNDFFIRKLKPDARQIYPNKKTAVIPADGRYLFYQNIASSDGFLVKGEKFKLKDLLQSSSLAKKYEKGAMIIARLCPTDYHRYHFPVGGKVGQTKLINGYLYSVNPIALKQNIHIMTKNKRTICEIESDYFGKVLFIEVGATNVGSINQTYTPNHHYSKGEEKGYFSFGASTLIILFEPDRLIIDEDLLKASATKTEILCLMGQSMGKAS